METDIPCIDTILRTFLEDASVGRSHHVDARYQRVMEHLRHYLEMVDANAVLGTDCGALLAAEREFHPDGAFARIFTAPDLVFCLSGFLDRQWLLMDPTDARSQVSLTSRLLQWIRRRYPGDLYHCSCGIYECTAAIRRARNSMRRPAGPRPLGPVSD